MTEAPRYVRLAPRVVIVHGALAATTIGHRHIPDTWTGSSCQACYGWRDDPQHLTLVRRVRRKAAACSA